MPVSGRRTGGSGRKEGTRHLKRVHYGWWVCLAGTLLIFITMGVASNGFSIFMPYVREEIGLTNTQTSSLVTIRCLVSFLSMLVIGKYYQLFSLRAGTAVASALVALGYCIYGFSRTYLHFCVSSAILGLGYGMGTMIPVSLLMNRWFVKHQALALSICATGSGLATVLMPPVTTWLVEHLSLSAAFLAEGVAIFALTLVIALVMRNDPAEMGLLPYGAESAGQEARATDDPARTESGAYFPASAWVLIFLVSLGMGAVANPGISHLAVLYTSEGFPSMTVALLVSATGVMITLSKILYGSVSDWIGGLKSSVLFGLVLTVAHGMCCLAFTGSLPVAGVTVFLLGLGYPIATVGPSLWAGELSPKDRYPAVLRSLQLAYAGGSLLCSNVPGLLADTFQGSYLPAYGLFTVLLAASLVLLVLSYRAARRIP